LSFSLLIPARNAAATLARCLEAVRASTLLPDEILVVNDGSKDATRAIAERFGCRIIDIDLGRGPMEARFAGSRFASFPMVIFVDADVCVRPETFRKIVDTFEKKKADAVTGILARETVTGTFWGDYKNEYMNWIFSKRAGEVDFVYGSIWAIRKECLEIFNPVAHAFGTLVSDTELGLRLSRLGRRIILEPDLIVDHLRPHSFKSLFKNDFVIPFLFSLIVLRYLRSGSTRIRKRFSHASLGQVAAGMAVCASAGFAIVAFFEPRPFGFLSLACLLAFYSYWAPFLLSIGRRRSVLFFAGSVFWTPLDACLMMCGMMTGFFWGVCRKVGKWGIRLCLRK